MDLATLIGIGAGLLVMAFAMFRGGSLRAFLDLTALAVTLGGAAAATLIHHPLPRIKESLSALRRMLFARGEEPAGVIQTFMGYAERCRREGVLALEEDAETNPDPFTRKALQLIVDGTDPETVREMLELDLGLLESRHRQQAAVWESLATYAPGFGMVGTLIALVKLMRAMDSGAALGAGMGSALLATFYGVVLANLLFQPLAGKIKVQGSREVLRQEMVMEGVLALQAGDTPPALAARLNAFLPPDQQVRRAGNRAPYPGEEE